MGAVWVAVKSAVKKKLEGKGEEEDGSYEKRSILLGGNPYIDAEKIEEDESTD